MLEFYQPHDAMLGPVVFLADHLTNDRRAYLSDIRRSAHALAALESIFQISISAIPIETLELIPANAKLQMSGEQQRAAIRQKTVS